MNSPEDLNQEKIEELIEKEVEKKLDAIVHEKVSKEEDVRFRQLKWIMIFIGIVGLSTFGTLANYLIEKAVDSRIERNTGNISKTLDFLKFYTASVKLDLSDSFTPQDKDLIMNYLRRAKDDKGLRHSSDFVAALVSVTNSFASAGQSDAIDEIFATYESEILSSPNLVEVLLHHYGQEIVASRVDDNAGYVAFEKLERVAASSGVPELAMAYRVLYESNKPGKKNEKLILDLLEQSKFLNEEDRARFFREILVRTSEGNWRSAASPEGHNIEVASRKFLSAFSRKIIEVYHLDDGEILEKAATEGLSRDEAKVAASLIANSLSAHDGHGI